MRACLRRRESPARCESSSRRAVRREYWRTFGWRDKFFEQRRVRADEPQLSPSPSRSSHPAIAADHLGEIRRRGWPAPGTCCIVPARPTFVGGHARRRRRSTATGASADRCGCVRGFSPARRKERGITSFGVTRIVHFDQDRPVALDDERVGRIVSWRAGSVSDRSVFCDRFQRRHGVQAISEGRQAEGDSPLVSFGTGD